ncbi:MAG: DUF3489 domain-containing protein [Rhodoferax sp.]|nr:DUF3489 domain-containing protein [Rhodoferax sp.]
MLAHAIHHANGLVNWFPDNVKGGARQKVLQGLFNRALITPLGSDLYVAAEGYDALGCARPAACSIVPDPELDAAVALAEATWTPDENTNDTEKNEPEPADQAESGDVANEVEALATEPSSQPTEQLHAKTIRSRENSKQATIIGMLQRAEGATIAQICDATGWQPHTVRGTFAGAFKKKLGLTITSDKTQGGVRIYRATA